MLGMLGFWPAATIVPNAVRSVNAVRRTDAVALFARLAATRRLFRKPSEQSRVLRSKV